MCQELKYMEAEHDLQICHVPRYFFFLRMLWLFEQHAFFSPTSLISKLKFQPNPPLPIRTLPQWFFSQFSKSIIFFWLSEEEVLQKVELIGQMLFEIFWSS